jgi:hypothetical protein
MTTVIGTLFVLGWLILCSLLFIIMWVDYSNSKYFLQGDIIIQTKNISLPPYVYSTNPFDSNNKKKKIKLKDIDIIYWNPGLNTIIITFKQTNPNKYYIPAELLKMLINNTDEFQKSLKKFSILDQQSNVRYEDIWKKWNREMKNQGIQWERFPIDWEK